MLWAIGLAPACLSGHPQTQPAATSAGERTSFYISALTPQSSDGTAVRINELILRGSRGYIAVHADVGGGRGPGEVIGSSEIFSEGLHTQVEVTLRKPLALSANVFPMIHLEDNGNETYDFPHADNPAELRGKVVMILVDLDLD